MRVSSCFRNHYLIVLIISPVEIAEYKSQMNYHVMMVAFTGNWINYSLKSLLSIKITEMTSDCMKTIYMNMIYYMFVKELNSHGRFKYLYEIIHN